MRMRRVLWAVPVVAIAALSCDRAPIAAPLVSQQGRAAADLDPAFSQFESPASSGGFLGVTDLFNSNASVFLGDYPTPTVVQVQASGALQLRYAFDFFTLPPAGTVAGSIDPGGRRTGFNNDGCTEVSMVAIQFHPNGVGSPLNAWKACQDGLATGFSGNAAVVGSAFARRGGDGLQLIPGRCGGSGFLPCYTYHLGHNVTVTRIGATVALDASAEAIEPGESVDFVPIVTPASIGGLPPNRSQTVATPYQSLEWRFVPDQGRFEFVVCGTLRTCTYEPEASGTMQLTAVVNGSVQVETWHVEVQTADLELKCTPETPVRAENVKCVASATDGSTPQGTQWEFVASDPSVASYSSTGPAGALTWEGQVVVSGSVTVKATVGGKAQSQSASITVRPRDWSQVAVPATVTSQATPLEPGDTLPSFPGSFHDLGVTYSGSEWDINAMTKVTGGPNDGLYYAATMPYKVILHPRWNAVALAKNSEFYNAQPGTKRTVGTKTYCAQSRVLSIVPQVQRHEGMNAETNSHVEVYHREYATFVRPLAEKIIVDLAGDSKLDQVKKDAQQHAHAQSLAIVDGAHAIPMDCDFNYDRSVRIR